MAKDRRPGAGNVLCNFHHEIRISESGKARLLARSLTDRAGVWIPTSQIGFIDLDAGTLWIPEWLAVKNHLPFGSTDDT